jgi:nucleoside permease NupC
MQNFQGFIGIVVILGIALLMSYEPTKPINLKLVSVGLALQLGLAFHF